MLKVTVDGRFRPAMQRLMPDAIESQTVTVSTNVVAIYAEDPIAFLEKRLDGCLPGWRDDTGAHWYKQGDHFTDALKLLRVRHLALRALGHQEPPHSRIEVTPATPTRGIADLYGVPDGWLCQIPLIDKAEVYLYDATAPTETYVRRPERILNDGVRCGKCSQHIEKTDRHKHAAKHGLYAADIEWTRPSRFRRE